MTELKTFNKKQLEDFISSGEFSSFDFLPISEHRAKSQIRNPKASDDQTLLVLALYDGKLAGYVGCFPDYYVIDGKIFRYAWLSTLFVSEEFRGKRIAKNLLNKMFEEYDGNIIATEFTKEAEALYNILGVFDYVHPKAGKRYYFRSDASFIIPEKKPGTKPLKPLFQIADAAANSVLALKNISIKKPAFKFEILDHIDTESSGWISGFPCRRNADELNVYMKHPWVLEGSDKEDRYLFSSYASVFKYFWIKVYDENNTLAACSLLQLRDGNLKIPYLFSDSGLDRFIHFLSYFIVKNKIKTLTSYQKELNKKIEHSQVFPKIYERDFERRYLFHKQLIQHLPENFNPEYQDGDGDCMMT
ncbi:GNAT family N-acetyltransferase [Chryseobacterium sp. L7]|uniref:GNAT family N-acetyltransferase n=1 Tax=Chryseobacterium endalhagicum TaxID=2797638 RepID=A0ABS1QM22_9FLAO|nr:GNAT family N-acetyltransferase [Chryseobacterium endalhagicum]MBL1223089.1 GNAT family N-acetyltransferase [Chryseobacterium endalhagicum]